ncbi:MAG: DinB family protein [Chloroflexi bacterium]|nr:DinB family protein [Chloroflexota bacterium]MYB83926.1 DinB family protein [Chloroflexota bacterium]
MTTWGARFYGDPCRECGYSWAISPEEATALILDAPRRYAELLDSADGSARHPDLTWSVKAYVSHVADNLRTWAERIVSATTAGQTLVRPFEQDDLAEVRGYEHMALETALWSLGHSANIWADAVAGIDDLDLVLEHPERGMLSLAEVILTVAHDTAHHEWDIRRSLGS